MRILVTGGAGFIGSNLAALAVREGHTVSIIDDFSTGHMTNIVGLPVKVHKASILDVPALMAAIVGTDAIIHLAALGSVPRSIADPLGTHEANATGTLTVLEAARRSGVEHVVAASSSSVYGANPSLPKRERDWIRPVSPYAVSKVATEQYVLAYQESYALETLAFRFFNVYGPRQRANQAYAAVIPLFLRALLRGEPLYINGDGNHSRDFTYVETVCKVLLDAVVRRVSYPEPVNLAFGTNTKLTQLVKMIELVSQTPAEVIYREPRAGDVPASRADSVTLRALFPWVSATPLIEGLTQTLAWFKEQS